jgi:hypothetical protein
LSDVHIVKLGSIAGLYLDLLGHFPAGVDPVSLESTEDAIEAALFNCTGSPEARIISQWACGSLRCYVEGGRICYADPFKPSLAAPEFNAALEVRVENPHVCLTPPKAWTEPANPQLTCYRTERDN